MQQAVWWALGTGTAVMLVALIVYSRSAAAARSRSLSRPLWSPRPSTLVKPRPARRPRGPNARDHGEEAEDTEAVKPVEAIEPEPLEEDLDPRRSKRSADMETFAGERRRVGAEDDEWIRGLSNQELQRYTGLPRGGERSAAGRTETFERNTRLAMQVLITFVGLTIGAMFILDGCHAWLGWCQKPATEGAKSWASGIVGTVVGFWLTKA